jgi:DNA mismatch repair protein MutS2
MNSHTLKVLEYRSILERLIHHCRSVPGKRRAEALQPYDNKEVIDAALDLVSEMNEIFEFDGGPPGLTFSDLGEKLDRARSDAHIFEPKELLEFANFFKIVSECQKIRPQYERLHGLLADLVYPSSLHREIENAVDLTGEIKDSASPELKRLRKELVAVKGTLNEKFERYLRTDTAAYLSDNLYTIRDGRYVLPVRETDKGRVRGIIHDRSSSGATFFIEPSETVELNNHHRELETAEREEINRILRHLSEMLYVNLDAIKGDVSILSHLDFIAACSRLARELGGLRPVFSENGDEQAIVSGRHPELLLSKDERKKGEVVPLTLRLTRDENITIITGPNTGGKTVALKTVGLLSLMAASALYVPADSKSRFVLFDEIFADIGDEQSIESSLSTYSSHLNHIKEALEQADRDSLVLFDELGAGTDPEEGAAMGQAIIEYLSAKRCFAIVTTHQGKLKALAGKVPGVVNGSMEFDRRNLRPTFVFHAGIPGSSYAVEIGRKLGLSDKITDRAWELLDQKERDLTNLIGEINQKSIQLSEELKKATADRLSYESLTKIYSDKLEAWQISEREMRKKHLKESEELIKATRMELDRLLEAAREKKKDREALRTIRKEVAQRLDTAREELSKMETAPSYAPARGLPGEMVHVRGIDANGEVLEPADSSGRVRVRIGNATMLTDLENLTSRSEATRPKPQSQGKVKTDYQPSPGMEIDIRGMTFDEAEPIIERFLDDAANAGLEIVSIIHGKGTGALRKKVQTFLDQSQRVESHRLGYWNEGSSGVTVVTLKKE